MVLKKIFKSPKIFKSLRLKPCWYFKIYLKIDVYCLDGSKKKLLFKNLKFLLIVLVNIKKIFKKIYIKNSLVLGQIILVNILRYILGVRVCIPTFRLNNGSELYISPKCSQTKSKITILEVLWENIKKLHLLS